YQGAARIDLVQQTYDRMGNRNQLIRYADPINAQKPVTWAEKHDSLGDVIASQEPGQQPVVADYDEWGELLSSKWIDGSVEHRVPTAYDGLGRPTQHDIVRQTPPFAEAVEWSEALTYDHVTDPTLQPGASFLGRLSSDKVNNIATAYYGYDALGAPSDEIQV